MMEGTAGLSRIVVDTNVLVDNLELLNGLVELSGNFKHIIVIPQEVTRELDGLKNKPGLGSKARSASRYIFEALANGAPGIMAQRSDEKINKSLQKDDAILDCCMYYQRASYTIVLLSNDTNLCIKALSENIPTVTYRPRLQAKEVAAMIATQAQVEFYVSDVEMMDVDDDPVQEVEHVHSLVNKQDLLLPTGPAHNERQSRQPTNPVASLHNGEQRPHPTRPSQLKVASTEELPPPHKLRYSKYRQVATLRDDVSSTLLKSVRDLSIYRMQKAWSDSDYQKHVHEEPEATTESLSRTLFQFWTQVFSEFLADDLLDKLATGDFPKTTPTSKSLERFILFWGTVCLSLAGNAKEYQNMYNNIEKVCSEFYRPPSRTQSMEF